MKFYDAITNVTRKDPDRIAIVCGDTQITYSDLAMKINDSVGKMMRHGVTSNDIVAVNVQTPIEFIRDMVASMLVGCRIFPVLPSMGLTSYERIISELDPHAVIDKEGIRSRHPFTISRLCGESEILSLTSGSCGSQKIVVRPMGNLVDEAESVANHLGLGAGQRVFAMTPLPHSFGCGLWRASLYAGATLYTVSAHDINSRIVQIRNTLEKGVDFVFGVPYLYQLLVKRHVKLSIPVTSRCFAGGETLPESVARQWLESTGVELQQEYGLSEGGITTLADNDSPSYSIGVPIPGVALRIINRSENGVGELVVYRRNPPVKYLFEGASDTFLSDGGIRTGDLVETDGCYYYFVSRSKSVIVVAGLKVTPKEVEDAVTGSRNVEDVSVVGVKDDSVGERPVAFVIPVTRPLDVDELRTTLRFKLDSYKVPHRIIEVDEFPRTSSGKVDKNALIATL